MKTMTDTSIRIKCLFFLFTVSAALFSACEEEDPFVDREASPVLIVFGKVPGYLANGGLTLTPTRIDTINAGNYQTLRTWTVSFYELDKSEILDNTVGIDSIPVVNLAVKFTKRDGTLIADLTTDSDGKVIGPIDWAALIPDVATIVSAQPARTIDIPVSWKGTYKGQSFTRYSIVRFLKLPS